jgi:hypothetical protein
MTDNNRGWTAAKVGDSLREGDERDLEESPTYWWVSHIEDEEILRALLILKEQFAPAKLREHLGSDVEPEDVPDRVEETRLFRQMFRIGSGETIHRALRDSDLDRQSAIIGLGDRDDAGGTGKLLRLVDRIEGGYIGYMFGSMGAGKTDFAIYLSEIWTRMHESETTIGSNIKSFERAETVERYENLTEWVQNPGERLFIWDEASSTASGYSAEAHEVMNKFRGLLQSFRKNRCNLLIIGHTGKDVHPHIRRQARDKIHKESKEKCTIYETVNDNGEPEGKRFSVEGIEATSWNYDTREMSRWYWNS